MIFNLTKKRLIAANPVFCKSRSIGIVKILGNDFAKNDAVVLQNKKFIFTFFCNLHVDIIFTDIENAACAIYPGGTRKYFFKCSSKAQHIICISKGQIENLNIEKGDKFNLNIELTVEFKKRLEKSLSRAFVSSPTVMSEK